MSAPSPEYAAIIVEYAASLGPLLQTDDLPPRVRTALTTIYQRGLAYAEHGRPGDVGIVQGADDALRKLVPPWGSSLSAQAKRAVLRGYEVAAAVRAAADPPVVEDVFDAVDRAAAAECGITVAEYRADDDEMAERWRTQLVVRVVGIDTDAPTVEGLDGLSVAQLRHIHHDLARMINAKIPPPPEPPTRRAPSRVAAEDAALPLRYSGQQVA